MINGLRVRVYENPRAVTTEMNKFMSFVKKGPFWNVSMESQLLQYIKYPQLKMLHHGKAIFLVTVNRTFDVVTSALMLRYTDRASRGNSRWVKCADANSGAQIFAESGVAAGTLQKRQRNIRLGKWKTYHQRKRHSSSPWVWSHDKHSCLRGGFIGNYILTVNSFKNIIFQAIYLTLIS